ncbi:hypothetical protein FRC09_018088 [Ceratobasidium sp. 395]|nr:hypothetical protein FRC09_018088 [Ceratobasidium sp. 395]
MQNDSLWSPAIFLGGTLVALWYLWHRRRNSVPLPPGPKGHVIYGSAMELQAAGKLWLKLSEYADQYGGLISVRTFHKYVFAISDPDLATELLEKRATNYSDRDVSPMMKLVGWDRDVLFLSYGPLLKRYRTMLQRALNSRVSQDYIPLQQNEAQKFMRRLVETPDDFMAHVHLMGASITIRIAYGYNANSSEDRFIKRADQLMTEFSDAATPGKWAVDMFPFLRNVPIWFPFATFQRQARYWRNLNDAHQTEPFDFTLKQMAGGTAKDSFTSKLLQPEGNEDIDAETKEHIKILASNLYGAGSDTTVSAVQSFFLAMTLYPDVQAKAQAEIAAYVGQRLDTASNTMLLPGDRSSLPYTSALVRELLRWHPIVNLVMHRSSDLDDCNVVAGGKVYRIPARSPVFVNVWKIVHDPDVYTEPERFMPERYLVDNPPPEPENYAFGFGRSNTLANFTITKTKDADGQELLPEENYSAGFLSHPAPFKCTITPRAGCEEWLRVVAE